MPKRIHKIVLDSNKSAPLFEINKLDSLHLEVEVTEVETLENAEVELFFKKSDGTLVSEIISEKEQNILKIDVKNGALDVPGIVVGQAKITEEDGNISSHMFKFNIKNSITSDDAIVNEIGIGAIEELKKKIDNAQVDPEVLKQKIEETINNGDLDVVSKEELKQVNLQLDSKAHKAYVTYEEFGAKLDGATDDTISIINCHNYANQYNLPVKQNKGILYMPTANINNCPIINTETDLTGLTIKFDNNNDGNTVFLIADSNTLNENKEVKYKVLNTSEIQTLTTSNSDSIPWLEQYKNHCVVFETDMSLGKRGGVSDDTNTYYHIQPMITNDYGQLSPNNLYCNIADNATNVKMYYLPLTQKNITIKFGEIILSENCNSNPRILINRNNTTVKGGIITKLNNRVNESVWSVSLFQFSYCANVTFEEFTGNTPVTNDYGHDITSYVLLASKCYNVKINDNNLLKGHGAVATHFINFLTFENNYINRFDNHYGLYGSVFINNNNIVGIPCCINLGYGSGNVYINNNTFYTFYENGFASAYHNIKFRDDFSLWYSGNIYINNVYIESNITNTSIYTSTLYRFNPTNKTSGFVNWGIYNVPFVSIKNINFKKNSNESNIRYFYIQNSTGKDMKFLGLEVDTPTIIEQSPSYLNSDNITGNIAVILKNTNLLCNTQTNQGVISSYGKCQIDTENINCVINNYGSLSSNGTIGIKTINNYSSLTVNCNITTLNNYGYLKVNSGLITNLYSYNKIEGVINVNSAFMSGYISLSSLTSTGEVRINGAFINCTNYNMTGGCIVTGCNMYSSTAQAISSVSNYQGFGNLGGSYNNLVNTYKLT